MNDHLINESSLSHFDRIFLKKCHRKRSPGKRNASAAQIELTISGRLHEWVYYLPHRLIAVSTFYVAYDVEYSYNIACHVLLALFIWIVNLII